MKVSIDKIDKLAKLAKLHFNEEEKQIMLDNLNNMVSFIDCLNEVNTDNVEPLVYINQNTNVFREDSPRDWINQEEALKNAPEKDGNYFRLPKFM
ncbi:Asp-tRNA(Asn)/Glu-tRNA(Gln) amidotransferase subunit GatC [Ichthyobacterium seriolicida]|uniref:Aspartyl/glutamyl-tRNA(Asn/Gln) amidotransferase subunit C n=1 Tax=Ichthyobacterium seriolicida TaxID=242600 RepID=A0A1J1EAL2_9FLAO|nr:Asp-tRNA(Asn)/Glu-tRNA(Gln) amidotransferase subunit GatC [Ichthyobacterium seriolicida]BAV94979.1 aspartyl-tRNA amidotransferase subunit C [Ichthyobacterium seriolicida]